MQNWCYNELKVTRPESELARFFDAFKGHHAYFPVPEESTIFIDRKQIMPLPGETHAEYNKRLEDLHFAAPKTRCFNALHPVPDEVRVWGYSGNHMPGYRTPEFYLTSEGIKAYGPTIDGHSWCITNWGTKWDIKEKEMSIFEEAGRAQYKFDTAWSPPIRWVEHVSGLFPELLFELNFTEERNGYVGIAKFQNGRKSQLDADKSDAARYWAIYAYIMELRGNSKAGGLVETLGFYHPEYLNKIKEKVNAAIIDKDSLEDNAFLDRTRYETYLGTVIECVDEAMPESLKNYAEANAEENAGETK